MSTNVVKKRKKRTGIKLIYLALALVLLAIPVCNVYTKAILSESNIALEEMKSDIKNQEEIYVGGHAFIKFKEGEPPTLTWEDIQEHVADDMEFVRIK